MDYRTDLKNMFLWVRNFANGGRLSQLAIRQLGPNENIRQTQRLGLYAITCQENGLVPMVEPEVLLEGSHSIDQAREASRKNLTALFEELKTLVWL